METFSALLAICVGNSLVTGEFPAKRPETQSFDVFFDLRSCIEVISISTCHFIGKGIPIIRIRRSRARLVFVMGLLYLEIGLNSSPPGQNGRHFADDTYRCIFVNENFCISIKILLKFVPKSPNDNRPALVQKTAWRRIGDKPISEPMLTRFADAYMRL